MRFVGREILQRPPPRSGIKPDNGKSKLSQTARQSATAGAGPNDGKIHRLIIAVLAHRGPAVDAKWVGRATAFASRHNLGIIRREHWPRGPPIRRPEPPPLLPTGRGDR